MRRAGSPATAQSATRAPAKTSSREPAITCRPLDHALQPRAHGFPDLFGQLRAQAALGRGLNDGVGDHMMRRLLERGAQQQYLVGGLAGRHLDGQQPRAADRQRSGLVEQHGVRARQRLQRARRP